MNKITRLFGTGRAISFPAGKPPIGTCEFATETCLKECADKLKPFKHEIARYELFCNMTPSELIKVITDEIDNSVCSHNKILSWFTESGDCPSDLTDKVLEVMHGLHVPQNGFTRNRRLWKKSHSIPNVHLGFTVEDESAGIELSKQGLVSVPDYKEERVKILKHDQIWLCGGGSVTCGCGTVEDSGFDSEEDCGLCHSMTRGCFAA